MKISPTQSGKYDQKIQESLDLLENAKDHKGRVILKLSGEVPSISAVDTLNNNKSTYFTIHNLLGNSPNQLYDSIGDQNLEKLNKSIKDIVHQKEGKLSGIGFKISKAFLYLTSFIPPFSKLYKNISNTEKNISSMTTFTKTIDLFSGFKNCKTNQEKQDYLQEATNKYGQSNSYVLFLKNKLSPEPKNISEKLKIINSRLKSAHDSADHYSVRLSKNLPEVKTSGQGSKALPIEHINQQFDALKDVADTNDFDEITTSLKTIIAQKEPKISGIGTKIAKLFFWCTSFIPASKKNYQNIDNAQKNLASMKKFVNMHDLFENYKKCTTPQQKRTFIEDARKEFGDSFEGVLAIDDLAIAERTLRATPESTVWE